MKITAETQSNAEKGKIKLYPSSRSLRDLRASAVKNLTVTGRKDGKIKMKIVEAFMILAITAVMFVSTSSCYGIGGLQAMNQKDGGSPQSDWKYRLPIEVGTGKYERYDKPVDIQINFTEQLKRLGVAKAFSSSSIRVAEVHPSGKLLDSAVPYQFDKSQDYDALTNASGTLVFMLKGIAPVSYTHLTLPTN